MIDKTSSAIITPLSTLKFSETLTLWQKVHGRNDLPWQQEITPYRVLVSELMLQQTQVTTVIPYFERWLQHFPTVVALAEASEDEVMTQWQGLGYYSRARNLHKAAKFVVNELNGQLPDNAEQLREVPGVGPYTAGAISAFAFNKPAAIVDGNVKRLFSRYFGIEGDISSAKVNKTIWSYAERYTPTVNNRRYAQALLDLGATVCTPRSPDCQQCPIRTSCNAYATGRVDILPEKKAKKKIPTRRGYFVLDLTTDGVILTQRSGDGIWPRLWCLPQILEPLETASIHGSFKHIFSHYKLDATVIIESAEQFGQRIPLEQLDNYGLPTPIRKYLNTLRV
ncbi:A/G-specific adenine glycosylase [Pseudidiomarina andamanensis]|uniref:Adenine DNA glycosylase n=1 Tax=Pseudidiomarina andamanensis TaxID=1940690 RepID=A0AA92ESU9_9GAMM|nr:A/G-specific adenine glycosylase [Pseudidiomarina andamanensis]MDS0218794.1 A/G-specific adenine glycosylase [Pseudidiomarina andamanensis]QGT95645.1 A/G-specific adenine glycosylase [Pseudidiomarina andamanensis]